MSPEVPEYASTKLIAYLGNKRAILPFILGVFEELGAEAPVSRFLDPFAGSGAVSRLARSLGWAVMANDAEEYSRAVNEAWLGVSADEEPSLFAGAGGFDAALASFNALHPSREDAAPDCPAPPYLARHYAPASTQGADWRRERLFFTAENAVFLDRTRCAIEHGYPASGVRSAERALLLGLLVYEAATHANTSGVFKAYHKGFGGHGRDALGRILSPMRLQRPLLWPGAPSEVGRGDAAAFCAPRPADLCYLDPPYNQHQYGSNYHLLNTIARWDRPGVSDERRDDGSLVSAAGIPPAWKESRSAFCSKRTAAAAFRDLVAEIDARFLLLSYNTEGFVPAEELFDVLSDRADVSLRSLDYVKYRGGRQSASRRSRNSEILFVARRREVPGRPAGGGRGSDASFASGAREALGALKSSLRLARALAGPFDPAAFRSLCGGGETLAFRGASAALGLRSYKCLVLYDAQGEAVARLGAEDKEALASLLEGVLLADNGAACSAAAGLLEAGDRDGRLQGLALGWLRKLAHRGYSAEFRALSARLRAIASSREAAAGGRLTRLSAGLDEVEAQFEARIAGGRRHEPLGHPAEGSAGVG